MYVDFGDQRVLKEEKASHVAGVFSRVAPAYDVMNDLMSFGMHRLWKRFFAQMTDLKPGDSVLDVASGTGDVARLLHQRVGEAGRVVMTDINADMLQAGRARLLDAYGIHTIPSVVADAESLPFPDHTFDCVTVAFGLRNMTDKAKALRSFYRVLKPGGSLLILEFSKIKPALESFYDVYANHVIPKIGGLVAGDAASYQYLIESIRRHPDQKALLALMAEAGFERSDYVDLFGGIVAIHRGYVCR